MNQDGGHPGDEPQAEDQSESKAYRAPHDVDY